MKHCRAVSAKLMTLSIRSFRVIGSAALTNPDQKFFVMTTVRPQWRLPTKAQHFTLIIDPVPDDPFVTLENKSIPILDVSSKQIYKFFLEKSLFRHIGLEKSLSIHLGIK